MCVQYELKKVEPAKCGENWLETIENLFVSTKDEIA